MTAAVILAAGASTRLGEPKQLVRLGGETLVDRAIRVATEAGCSPVIVVLGANVERIRSECALSSAVVLVNEQWTEGMGSSIRRGVAAVRDAAGLLVMACDMPTVTPDHLRALNATGEATASSYAGRKGVPAYFPASSFPQLMELRGDAGARELLRSAAAVDLPSGEVDVDSPADVVMVQGLFRLEGDLDTTKSKADSQRQSHH